MKKFGLILSCLFFLAGCSFNAGNESDTILNELMQKGDSFFVEEKYEEAEEVYSEILEKDKEHADALINRARTRIELGNLDAAKTDIELVPSEASDTVRYYEVKGYYYWSKAEYTDAVKMYTKAIEKETDASSLLYGNRARSYYADHKLLDAQKDLDKALELEDGKTYFNYYMQAEVYLADKKFEKAVEPLDEMNKLQDGDLRTKAMKAYSLKKQIVDTLPQEKQDELSTEAEKLFAESKTIKEDAIGMNYIAMYYMLDENFIDAKEILDEAEKLEKKQGGIYNNRAMSRYYLGDTLGAFEDIEKALKLDPKEAEFHLGKGYILMTNKQEIPAKTSFRKAYELDKKMLERIPEEFHEEVKKIGGKSSENA